MRERSVLILLVLMSFGREEPFRHSQARLETNGSFINILTYFSKSAANFTAVQGKAESSTTTLPYRS